MHLVNQTVGEYRVVNFLGAGGMGEVYRAEHSKIGRVAAVKVLTQAAGGDFAERFFNEARIQASLQHPNIATLYDFLEVGGRPCIIMEYVDGPTLSERIESCGSLPLAETVSVFRAVAEAVGHIHGQGIIHRDIKSNNIKISSSGQVKLLDFGIAKGRMSPGLTEAGSVVGTLLYLPPEYLKGGIADARGDVWALGVLLYEMVTGRMPFECETLGELCERIDKAAYVAPTQLDSSVPREVTGIIDRCLKKNPAERYQTAQDLLPDVRGLAALVSPPDSGGGGVGQPSRLTTPPASPGSKNLLLAAGGGAALLVLLLVATGAYLATSSSPGQAGVNATAAGLISHAPADAPAAGAEKSIELTLTEGRADVYRGGQLLGTTPYKLRARVGERIKLTLKRDGYRDEPVDFSVSESRREYVFRMTK